MRAQIGGGFVEADAGEVSRAVSSQRDAEFQGAESPLSISAGVAVEGHIEMQVQTWPVKLTPLALEPERVTACVLGMKI